MKDIHFKIHSDGWSYDQTRHASWFNLECCPDVSMANTAKELMDIMTSERWTGIKPTRFRYLERAWWSSWNLFDFIVDDVKKECESRDYWWDDMWFIFGFYHTLLSRTRLFVNEEDILWIGSDDCWMTLDDFKEVAKKVQNEFDWVAKDLYIVCADKFYIPAKEEWIEAVKKKPDLYLKPYRLKDENPVLEKRIKSLIKLNKAKK
jgi:hypothetical protein